MEWLALQTKSGAEPDIGLNSQQIQARLAAAATFDIARCYYPAGHERAGEIMSVIDMPADVRKLIDGVEEITLKGGAVKRRVLFAPRIQSLSLLAELRGDKARVKGVAKPAGPRATFNINIGPGRRKGKPGDRGRVIEAEQRSISAPDSEQDEETGASA